MSIQIQVRNKVAVNLTPEEVIVCGNSGYVVEFSFDEEWASEAVKTARFVYRKGGQNYFEDKVFSGTTVNVPVLSNINHVLVGVYAGELTTTTPAVVECTKSILCGSGTHKEPTPNVYNQIIELLNEESVFKEIAIERARVDQLVASQGTGASQVHILTAHNMGDSASARIYSDCIHAKITLYRADASFEAASVAHIMTIPGSVMPLMQGKLVEYDGLEFYFDKEVKATSIEGSYLKSDGTLGTNSAAVVTEPIYVSSDMTYYVNACAALSALYVVYDADGNVLEAVKAADMGLAAGEVYSGEVVMPDGARYIRLSGTIAELPEPYMGISGDGCLLFVKNTTSQTVTFVTDSDGMAFDFATYPLADAHIPEVNDIRVGFDGTKYETAGDAVREQIRKAMESGKEFFVSVTGEDEVYTANQTYEDTMAAYNAGRRIVCVLNAEVPVANGDTYYADGAHVPLHTLGEDGIFIFQHGTVNPYGMSLEVTFMPENLISAVCYVVSDGAGSGGGSGGNLNITDDGEGNVTVVSSGGISITDDGSGNVTIG